MASMIEIIDQLCEQNGIKGSKLCDDLGISRSTLTELRKGRAKTLSLKKTQMIADYFGVSIEYLTGDQETSQKTSELYDKIAKLCADHGISIGKMCSDLEISRGNLTDLKMGRIRSISSAKLQKIADYFSVSLDFFSENEKGNTKKAPALTRKDERDIAKTLANLKETLENEEGLMVDGDPMSDEAKESILAAMELGLQAAKLKNKEKYTPKKYKKD